MTRAEALGLSPSEAVLFGLGVEDGGDEVIDLGRQRWQTREDRDGRLEVVARVSERTVVLVPAAALARLAGLWLQEALDEDAAP